MPDTQIFISYRRADSTPEFIPTFFKKLINSGHFTTTEIFWDSKSLNGGVDWDKSIRDNLLQCKILIIIIGDNWQPERLHGNNDYVRLEIETTLQNDKYIIPVRVGNGDLPQDEELPYSLRTLLKRQFRFINIGSDYDLLLSDVVEWYKRNVRAKLKVNFGSNKIYDILKMTSWDLNKISVHINGKKSEPYLNNVENSILIYLGEDHYSIYLSEYLGSS